MRELSAYSTSKLENAQLEAVCQVEIGLYLQQRFSPGAPAVEAWTLFSGYPFAKARGLSATAGQEQVLRVARYTMWTLRRRRAWKEALESYQQLDRQLRGYDVVCPELPAVRLAPPAAPDRWDTYDELLSQAPPLEGAPFPLAKPGPHGFFLGRGTATVDLPLLPTPSATAHDMDESRRSVGPLTFSRAELLRTAAEMDAIHPQRWVERMGDPFLSTSKGPGAGFEMAKEFTVDGLQHLLGIVGAGKSTLRDVIAVHLAKCRVPKRVTVVVGDVAEVLKLVKLYNLYTDHAAAPVLGASGKERHAQRLHRRLAGGGEHRLLAHDDPAFAYLSTSCALNALRPQATDDPLTFGEAPCARLLPPSTQPPGKKKRRDARWQKQPVGCPLWSACPRHHAARALVDADIWVTTMPALVDAGPPRAQNGERIRYLELACRRSDLIIVDEADRVQMQLDEIFAPGVPLVGGNDKRAFLDDVNEHKVRELAVGGRTQLSDRDVENWSAALNTATTATDRLYAMLVGDRTLRDWVRTGYFNAWTLQLRLLEERYPKPKEAAAGSPEAVDVHKAERDALVDMLDAFRDNPFGDRGLPNGMDLVKLTGVLGELLHTGRPERTRARLRGVMDELFRLTAWKENERAKYEKACEERRRRAEKRTPKRPPKPLPTPEEKYEALVKRFEFTLMLCALEPKIALMNAMWPRVQTALNLGFNEMYRRPADYGPMVPEAPMGNLLGFRFHVKEPDEDGVRSGELTFFRCSGVGRELLREMPNLPTVDGMPSTNVLLMSGSSWAGTSSRYHIQAPVGVLLEPPSRQVELIAEESEFRIEFLHGAEGPLHLSGADLDARPAILRRMAMQLGAGEAQGHQSGGPLELELRELPPDRDQILLLVGSYEEARLVADTLHTLEGGRWQGKVLRLVSDDDDLADDDSGDGDDGSRARVLRRGDVESLADCEADVLVAPLKAIERGHNILNREGQAAIGTVYFLARPHPHPEDLSLAVHAINDWLVRALKGGQFDTWVREAASLDDGARKMRNTARSQWYRVLMRSMAWSRLGDDREQVTWDMLVLIWQVIGRLVRGGVPARVVFVDAAFAPKQAADPPEPDTPKSSLLFSIVDVLARYFEGHPDVPEDERHIVKALYGPLWEALNRCLADAGTTTESDTEPSCEPS
ncbi:hypothetical protein [Streptomyces pinistramenti]|uniref:pPIWI_RE_Z domain-containing protein n=1 Tax=Streptomyces pinistramenti TaxID=2884812 RepID=UPI001D07458A|nr:hypothetical protein [Streptomyces pinistramenti]MCB5909656.1 hypothetical protein [Streptomyces pinistramenti]